MTVQHPIAPAPFSEREREIHVISACGAMIKALACADNGFTRAGVTFERDGQLTKAKHSGHTVASFHGRFSMQTVIDCIRSNISDHAQGIAIMLQRALSHLVLPAGHTFRLDLSQNLSDILSRGSCRISAYACGRAEAGQALIFAEFQFALGECRAQVRLKAGDRFGAGDVLIGTEDGDLTAETYAELAALIITRVNSAIKAHLESA